MLGEAEGGEHSGREGAVRRANQQEDRGDRDQSDDTEGLQGEPESAIARDDLLDEPANVVER